MGGPRLRGRIATTCVAADRMELEEPRPSPDGGLRSPPLMRVTVGHAPDLKIKEGGKQ